MVQTDLLGGALTGAGGGEDCVPDDRALGEEQFLAIFYRYRTEDEDDVPRNAITMEMVDKVRAAQNQCFCYHHQFVQL